MRDLLSVLRAGVANIMAYSWFSHCKKYLAALEAEKRFARTTKARPRPPTMLVCHGCGGTFQQWLKRHLPAGAQGRTEQAVPVM